MICPKCGENNPDIAKFCGKCATPLSAAVPAAPPQGGYGQPGYGQGGQPVGGFRPGFPAAHKSGGASQFASFAMMGAGAVLFLLTFIGYWVEGADNRVTEELFFSFPGILGLIFTSALILTAVLIGYMVYTSTTKARTDAFLNTICSVAMGISVVHIIKFLGIADAHGLGGGLEGPGGDSLIGSIGWAIEEVDGAVLNIFETLLLIVLWAVIFVAAYSVVKKFTKKA